MSKSRAEISYTATTKKVWKGPAHLRKLLVPIAEIEPHPENARVGSVPEIAASLERFGQQKPVVTQSGVVYAGNHLWKAAMSLGWTHLARSEAELSGEEAEAYLIADNRLSDVAGYNPSKLRVKLEALRDSGNLSGTGYDSSQLERQLSTLASALADSPAAKPPDPIQPQEHVCPSCGHVWTGDPRPDA